MAQTILFTKKNFLNWIAKQIKDDECVIMSDTLNGTVSVSKKAGYKVPFAFTPDIFPTQDVRNIMSAKSLSTLIVKIPNLSATDQEEIKTQPIIE